MITGTFANGRTECQISELLETHEYTPEKCLQHFKFLNQSEMRGSDLGAFERIFETRIVMCIWLAHSSAFATLLSHMFSPWG